MVSKSTTNIYPFGKGTVRRVRLFSGQEFEYGRSFDEMDQDQLQIYKDMLKRTLGLKVRTIKADSLVHVYSR